MYSFVSFPYMIPDNSCEVNTVLGSYFLNTDTIKANKGINHVGGGVVAGERIEEDDYNNIKNQISYHLKNDKKSFNSIY